MSQADRGQGSTSASVGFSPSAHQPAAGEATGVSSSMLAARPLIQHFLDRVREDAERVAFRYKDLGIWQEVTWSAYRARVERLALGLGDLGVSRGACVAVLASTRQEWLYADLAVQSIGALVLGIPPATTADDLSGLLDGCAPTVILAGDIGQLDRVLQSGYRGAAPVVLLETGAGSPALAVATRPAAGMLVHSYAEIEERGAAAAQRDPASWERLVAEAAADDPIGAFCTVGTTGAPKAALLSSRNLVLALASVFEGARQPRPGDRVVAQLPLAYIGERQLTVYAPILYGCVSHLPEDPSTIREATTEVQPTLLVSFPGEWLASAGRIEVAMRHGDPLARSVYSLAMRARRACQRAVLAGRRPSFATRLAAGVASWTVCRPLLDKFGYRRLATVLVTGAPLPPAVAMQWALWGVELREVYSLTEAAGFVAVRPRTAAAGGLQVLNGLEARIAADSELLLRGPTLFRRYVGSGEGLDDDDWFYTGDLAELDAAGGLRIVGRKQDGIDLGGRLVMAGAVEQQLRMRALIREAFVCEIGSGELGALLELDVDAASTWARDQGVAAAGYSGLASAPAVRDHIVDEVAAANRSLTELGLPTVAGHRLFPRPLDPDGGDEVTATRTVKRGSIGRKYRSLLDEMGGGTGLPERMAQLPATAHTGTAARGTWTSGQMS